MWYRETFNQDYLDIYTPFLEERTQFELQGLLTLTAARPGQRLLDLCCGHGRHALELAARGFAVTAVDLSRAYLDQARQTARGRGLRIRWLRKDMRDLPYREEFDLVINLYNAFGYFEEEAENLRVLKAVARALAPGGAFFLDLLAARPARDDLGQMTLERAGFTLHERVEYVPETRRLLLHHTVVRRSTQATYLHSLRLYEPDEIEAELAQAGLQVEGQWGDFDGRAVGTGERLITLARKS